MKRFSRNALAGIVAAGLLLPLILLSVGGVSMAQDNSKANSARDPEIAVQEQLEMARAAGTVAAYELFIARYPGHPLQATARDELKRLRR